MFWRRWNHLPPDEAMKMILPCCGSKAWAQGWWSDDLLRMKRRCWLRQTKRGRGLTRSDWLEAFQSHPRIGESRPANSSSTQPHADHTL